MNDNAPCVWCEERAGVIPMVSGASMPMICRKCGTRVCAYGYQEIRFMMEQYERRIKHLEEALRKERNK